MNMAKRIKGSKSYNKEINRARRMHNSYRYSSRGDKEYTKIIFETYLKSNEGKAVEEIFKVEFRDKEISALPWIINAITYLKDEQTKDWIMYGLRDIYGYEINEAELEIGGYADLLSTDDMCILKCLVPNTSFYCNTYPNRIALVALLKDKNIFLRIVSTILLNRVYHVWDILDDVIDFKDVVDNTLALSVLISFTWLKNQQAIRPKEIEKIDFESKAKKTIVEGGLFDLYFKDEITASALCNLRWEVKMDKAELDEEQKEAVNIIGEIVNAAYNTDFNDEYAVKQIDDKMEELKERAREIEEKHKEQSSNTEVAGEDNKRVVSLSPVMLEVLGEYGYDIVNDKDGIIEDLKNKEMLRDILDGLISITVDLDLDRVFASDYIAVLGTGALGVLEPAYIKLTGVLDKTQERLKLSESDCKRQRRELQKSRKVISNLEKEKSKLENAVNNGEEQLCRQLKCDIEDRDKTISRLLEENARLSAEVRKIDEDRLGIVRESSALKKQVKKLKVLLDESLAGKDNKEDTDDIDEIPGDGMEVLDEAIEYVKGKKWIIAGGEKNITRKLNGLGITNFKQVNGNYNKYLANEFEFVVVITYKVGHRVSEPLKDLAKHGGMPIVYVNSSNINKMLVRIYNEIVLKETA